MRGRGLFTTFLSIGLAAALTGCWGGSAPRSIPAGTSNLTLTIQDTPPAGGTILSFQVSITGAVLNPAQTGGVSNSLQPVSVLNAPVDVELTQLATYSALLNEATVPEGSYQGITITFGGARLTYLNSSGADMGSCANGTICELTPTISPSVVTVSAAPAFPISLYASTPGGLQIDFNLAQSIQGDLSVVYPAITISQLSASQGSQGSQGIGQMNNLEGQVTSVNSTYLQFAMNTSIAPITILTNTSTQFDGFAEQGLTNNFAGVQVGQTVRSQAILLADGTLNATIVGLRQTTSEAQVPQLKGTITSIDSGTAFHMVVRDELRQVNGILVGDVVAVTLQGAPTFSIESDGLTIPSGLSFASASDLMVGQEVQITAATGSTGSEVTTDQIILRMSDITATVNAINPTGFTLGNLPSLYPTAGISAIQVASTPETTYNNVLNLTTGEVIAVRGLLFNSSETPTLVAGTVGPQIY